MAAFLTSPLFLIVPLLIGLIIGWLVREAMLLKQYNLTLAQIELDRDLARSESESLRDKLSMLEADVKKAAFDTQELSDRLQLAETDRHDLQKVIRDHKTVGESLKKELSALNDRIAEQDELTVGLRARIAQLTEQAENFTHKESAEKRLHEDFAAAIEKIAALEKQQVQLATAYTKLGHEKESLHTQLLDYQLKNAEMPGLLAANNASSSPKKRLKKEADQPLAAAENDPTNGESAPLTADIPTKADDLKIINTITAAQEAELVKIGITTIKQLANLTEVQILEIAEGAPKLAKKMQKENWTAQAQHVLGAV